ncbi:hypothetical protein RPPX_05120 [Pseudomonas putida S12]|uniref:Bacterial Ig domain-containing protein n=1 Tax=Pseudomonas putida S12 TaxID=1215087 RepID=A0AA34RSI3_PSEPU|nr:Ig-like domain-containing protein [Pseudomonas putida]AJA12749.1 hypothetical protein RPPX_05120 [Pseudomonas putida S12]
MAPTNLVIGLAGSQLSGRGEVGTTVQVRDAAGNILATGTVAADGTFSVTLFPAQANGEALDVRLVDAAGTGFTATDAAGNTSRTSTVAPGSPRPVKVPSSATVPVARMLPAASRTCTVVPTSPRPLSWLPARPITRLVGASGGVVSPPSMSGAVVSPSVMAGFKVMAKVPSGLTVPVAITVPASSRT